MYPFAAKLVQPFTFSVLLLGIVLITLRCRRRERQRALTVALVAYAVLVLASMNFVTELVLRPLEDRATPLAEPPHDVSAMVVLGAGGSHSLIRCGRAAQLYRPNVHKLVLVTGGRLDPLDPIEAEKMRDWLVLLGVPATAIVTEPNSQSTFENAVQSAAILRDRGIGKVVLVTDASHMMRATACFRKQGIEVVPGPCERITQDRDHGPDYYLPSAGAAKDTEMALREWIGIGWYWLRGRV
jgi:uncharacterized SAM-binding protein YcdF (DUF218 family)